MAKEANKKIKKDKKNFGKEVKSELKKVVWPKPAELAKSTLAVVVMVVVITVIVFCLDFVFESANKYGLDKIKEKVQPTEQTQDVEDNEEETSEPAQTESTENTENNEVTQDTANNENNENTENQATENVQ